MASKTPLDRVLETLGGTDADITQQRIKVGAACGVTRQAVEFWETDGIPPRHVFTLESATHGAVTAREMNEWSERKRREKAAA